MSKRFTWRGRKWTGSPSKLQKQTLKIVEKEKRLQYNDPHFLESNIVYGWFVDCCCGLKGVNVDDGHRMVECDVCKVWMHCICNNIPTQTKQELFKYFSKKRVWVCNKCKEGKFAYRALHWYTLEKANENKHEVTFDKKKKKIDGKKELELPKHNPDVQAKKSILKMESHFQRGKALPNPPSWILLLLLTILMSDLSTVCNKIVNSFNK